MEHDFKKYYPSPIQVAKISAEQQITNSLTEELNREINRRILEHIFISGKNTYDPLNELYKFLEDSKLKEKCSEKICINGYTMNVDDFLRLAYMIAKDHSQDYIEQKNKTGSYKINKDKLKSITYVVDNTVKHISGDYDYIRMHEYRKDDSLIKNSIYIPVGNINIASNLI